ncbi:MAG TPA: cobalamin biosynthesis protein CobQ [Trichormus sp.]|jgi:hypothetical protein
MADLRIAHLYAHFLNIYGDRGNILTLLQRARWRGINATTQAVGLDEPIDPEYFDFFFIGGGQDKQQQTIAEDLVKRAHAIKKAIDGGAVILAVCGGYQLLGHYYRPHEGEELKGISLVDAYTVAGNRRMIGNVVVRRDDGTTLVGFENHSGKTFLGQGVSPIGKAVVGNGNNGEDGFEGLAHGNVYGTYLHGSILPKNPQFADELLQKALARRHGDFKLTPIDDTLENAAHKRALVLPA